MNKLCMQKVCNQKSGEFDFLFCLRLFALVASLNSFHSVSVIDSLRFRLFSRTVLNNLFFFSGLIFWYLVRFCLYDLCFLSAIFSRWFGFGSFLQKFPVQFAHERNENICCGYMITQTLQLTSLHLHTIEFQTMNHLSSLVPERCQEWFSIMSISDNFQLGYWGCDPQLLYHQGHKDTRGAQMLWPSWVPPSAMQKLILKFLR